MRVGFLGLLGVLFVGLKLTHFIAWSWWLVLLPIYGPGAVALMLAGIALFGLGIGTALSR